MNNTTITHPDGKTGIAPNAYNEQPAIDAITIQAISEFLNDGKKHQEILQRYLSLKSEDIYTLVKCDKLLLYF